MECAVAVLVTKIDIAAMVDQQPHDVFITLQCRPDERRVDDFGKPCFRVVRVKELFKLVVVATVDGLDNLLRLLLPQLDNFSTQLAYILFLGYRGKSQRLPRAH